MDCTKYSRIPIGFSVQKAKVLSLHNHGLDIDQVLENSARSKNFTLLDLAAVVFAGPVGLAVTNGLDLPVPVTSDYGGITQIQKMVSNWKISNGILEIYDVAFATKKNRIAAQSYVNLIDKTVNITVTDQCKILRATWTIRNMER